MRISINGTGRIGRLLFRRLIESDQFNVVALNDIMPIDNLAYLLKYDSVYGTFKRNIVSKKNFIEVDDKKVMIFNEPDPSKIPWKELDIDVVLECTGQFTTMVKATQHIVAGAKAVILSTTGADDIPLLIYGFNHSRLETGFGVLSPGGCMTNCSIHVLYLLNSISIKSAHINFIHSYTSRQELVDTSHKNFRRGRAAAESIIPVAIDLTPSIERLMPGLKNKIETTSTRVPIANGAMGIFSVQLNEVVSVEQINELFKKASKNSYTGIIEYSEEPLVSVDIKGNPSSCIIDGTLTAVTGNHVTLSVWFDNEYGYTSRIIDWLGLLDKR
jgi:glyceraldehyde 3-phosphate dehydrogenase (phosphorylating)